MSFSLPKATLRLWKIRFLAALMLILSVCAAFVAPKAMLPISVAAILLAILLCPLTDAYLKSYSLCLKPDAILVTRGILWRRVDLLPYGRLVFIMSYKTPLSERLGLKGLIIGAARKRIFVPELREIAAKTAIAALNKAKYGD